MNVNKFIDLINMIDGVYPSQIQLVEALRSSHYHNLKNIINKHAHHISFPSPQLTAISENKRINHRNWRTFNQLQQQKRTYSTNLNLNTKLQKIFNKKSEYSLKTEPCPENSLLHHNYLSFSYKKSQQIQHRNYKIYNKIIKIKGIINTKKLQSQYKANQLAVSRLQKFQRYKRLSRVVNKSVGKNTNIAKCCRLQQISNSLENPQSI